MNLNIDSQSSKFYYQIGLDSILKYYDSTEIMLHGELLQGNKIISSADYFFTSPKNLKLQDPEIKMHVNTNAKGIPSTISISCAKPALNVFIHFFYSFRRKSQFRMFNRFTIFNFVELGQSFKQYFLYTRISNSFNFCRIE